MRLSTSRSTHTVQLVLLFPACSQASTATSSSAGASLPCAALAPFAVDRNLIRVVAALLDISVYRGLQRAGLPLKDAAGAIADIVHARVTRKD